MEGAQPKKIVDLGYVDPFDYKLIIYYHKGRFV
jgi:hypothetical protein